jgi:2-aminoadipate transaminase
MNYERFLSPVGRQLQESAIRKMGVTARRPGMISFAPGYPDPSGFPWVELRALANELLSGADREALQYGPTRGLGPLIDAVVDMLDERGIRAQGEQVLMTSGSQQGIDLVARLLVTPGDVVLVELPAYTGAISAFRNAGADLAGVAQQDDGIDLDHLEHVCLNEQRKGRRVNLLYLVPNFQNPTGVLLSVDKRRHLLEWAARRDVLIVEDDPYGALFFDDTADARFTTPIRAHDSEGRVIYLSTFSKTLAPGLRVGWMVAPAELVERFETAKQSLDLTTGVLDQRLVHAAIGRGVLERIAPALRELYRSKRDAMERALRDLCSDSVSWLQPKGGFFVWLQLPDGVDDVRLLAASLDRNVAFVPGSAFHVDGRGHDRIRLSYSAPSAVQIGEGIRRLVEAMQVVAGGAPGQKNRLADLRPV